MSPQGFTNPFPLHLEAAKSLEGNEGQMAAYESTGNCAILAGPGSGKTKTITIKIAQLLNEEIRSPHGVACITYSTECARELKKRLALLGVEAENNTFIGTVHGFCLNHVVRPYARLAGLDLPDPIAVADRDVWFATFEQAVFKAGVNENPAYLKTRIDKYRRTHVDRRGNWKTDDEEAARVIELFEKLLHNKGFIDFDDMVLIGLQLIERNEWVRKALRARFPVLVVDEYQDLGLPLHRIVLQLCFKAGIRVIAVGDPDQSIYGFTGADPELLRQFAEMAGVQQIPLQMNYRNGRTIVASSMVALGEDRNYKAAGDYEGAVTFWECPNGIEHQAETICNTIIPQALARSEGRSLGNIAVLYIDKYDASVITAAVKRKGYKYIGGDKELRYPITPLTRWVEDCAEWCSGGWKTGVPTLSSLLEMWLAMNEDARTTVIQKGLRKDLVSFLWAYRDPNQDLKDWLDRFLVAGLKDALDRMISRPDDKRSFDELYSAACDTEKLGGTSVATFGHLSGASDHLNLVTLHGSKGLEFDVVIIMGMDEGRIPNWRDTGPEPRRLFYVGLTRAKHEVHLVYSGWYENPSRRFDKGPSKFVLELRKSLNAEPAQA
jgi:DNA helicase II / ATP-dependent DNA helicase PcrA